MGTNGNFNAMQGGNRPQDAYRGSGAWNRPKAAAKKEEPFDWHFIPSPPGGTTLESEWNRRKGFWKGMQHNATNAFGWFISWAPG